MEYSDYTGILASNISELRRRAGMTQDALAEKLGVTFQAVSKWERGQSCPDISLLPLIAEIFGVSIDGLFDKKLSDASAEAVEEAVPRVGYDNDEANIIEDLGNSAADEENCGEEQEEECEFEEGSEKEERSGGSGRSWFRNIFGRTVYRCGSEYIPQDDGKLRVLLFRGNRLLERYDKLLEKITFRYEGEALDVLSMLSVECGGVGGDVDAGTSVRCESVSGDVDAGMSVECADVGGSVDAGTSVKCGSVGGNVDAGTSVRCGDVGGDVDAGTDVTALNVAGSVNAGAGVQCGDVAGDVKAGGNVTCGDVDGDVEVGGGVYRTK